MLSLARAAALVAAPLAVTALDDAVLLQVKAAVPDPSITYTCDEVHGCRYNLPATTSDAPFKLVCDDSTGCRYEGVTTPPPRPRLLPAVGPETLQKLMQTLGQIKLPDLSKWQEQMEAQKKKTVEFISHIPEELKKLNLPSPQKMQEDLKKLNLLPDLSKKQEGTPDLAKLFRETAKQGLGDLAKRVMTPSAPAATGPTAFFMPDNGMCCVQGPLDYLKAKVEKLKVSPLGDGYKNTVAKQGKCADQGYNSGPAPEKCFPQAQLFMSTTKPLDVLSEPVLMARFVQKRGFGALATGMVELCKQ